VAIYATREIRENYVHAKNRCFTVYAEYNSNFHSNTNIH